MNISGFIIPVMFIAGPTVWNSLPKSVRSTETLTSFKCRLKMYLFKNSFKLALSLINIINTVIPSCSVFVVGSAPN